MIIINSRRNEFIESDIIRLYKMFCAAYDVSVRKDDLSEMKRQAKRFIKSGDTLDYSPDMNAQLFIEDNTNELRVWGRAEEIEKHCTENYQRNFEELYTQFFVKNDGHACNDK